MLPIQLKSANKNITIIWLLEYPRKQQAEQKIIIIITIIKHQ